MFRQRLWAGYPSLKRLFVHRRLLSVDDLSTQAVKLRFQGLRLASDGMAAFSEHQVHAALEQATRVWKANGVNAVWVLCQPLHGHVLQAASRAGFTPHHCKPDMIHMMKWLPETTCRVPPYATHQVGVAGLCIDRKNDAVLVIREKDALITGYKLPGGLADPHEDIGAAAVREVYEETGVAARFRSIVGFREQHNVGFGVSDLYFVCRCEPVSTDITHCPREIAEAKWMPVDEYIHSTSQMNAAIARMVVGALRYECEQDEDMHSDPPSYNSGVALSCDVSTSQMDSVYVKDRIVNLHLPAAAMKYVNVDDPWGGQDHLPIHLIKK